VWYFGKPVANYWTREWPVLNIKPTHSKGKSNACNSFNHPASNGGIPSGSDELTFKTGVVLKKSSGIAKGASQPEARPLPPPTMSTRIFRSTVSVERTSTA
jgi:hypothetical protein